MTSIRGRGRPCRKCISKGLLKSSPPPKSSHDKTLVNPPAVKPPVAKYIEEDLHRILRTVFKAQAPPFDNAREKLLKGRLPDVYYGKSYIEYYNFCQKCEDHFATAGAKGPNCISFATSFLRDRINFR